jgi:glycerol uptake facilitator-like aquaporin
MNLARRLAAEAIGTALLLAIVVGSGIMGERLSQGNDAVTLLGNSIATGTGLAVLIFLFAPISGAHFNPVVTLSEVIENKLKWRDALAYLPVQIVAALAGVAAAHLMFGEALFTPSDHARIGPNQWWSEFIATFGLILVIKLSIHHNTKAIPLTVAAYITAAYWFTSSTSFANPAVTIARSLTPTFAGIRPDGVLGFIVAQLLGAFVAANFVKWLVGPQPEHS